MDIKNQKDYDKWETFSNNPSAMRKKHISREEKMEIRRLLKDGKKQQEIALFLDRNQSSISREIGRNSIRGAYHPLTAEKLSIERRIAANRANAKLLRNDNLRNKIVLKLSSTQEDWSPDTIA